jgi:hypothetical protein
MNQEPDDDTLSDARVRRAYQSLATERTPAEVDAAVLVEARRARSPRARVLSAWARPVAFAASALLCVGLVLQWQTAPEPVDGGAIPAEPAAAAVHQAVIESRAQKLGEPPRAKAGPAAEVLGEAVPVSDEEKAPRCSAEDRRSPVAWMACIRDLETRGSRAPATAERELLELAFPAFDAGGKP